MCWFTDIDKSEDSADKPADNKNMLLDVFEGFAA